MADVNVENLMIRLNIVVILFNVHNGCTELLQNVLPIAQKRYATAHSMIWFYLNANHKSILCLTTCKLMGTFLYSEIIVI